MAISPHQIKHIHLPKGQGLVQVKGKVGPTDVAHHFIVAVDGFQAHEVHGRTARGQTRCGNPDQVILSVNSLVDGKADFSLHRSLLLLLLQCLAALEVHIRLEFASEHQSGLQRGVVRSAILIIDAIIFHKCPHYAVQITFEYKEGEEDEKKKSRRQ